jgi:hypothetical protein
VNPGPIEIVEESIASLLEYGQVSIAFTVDRRFDVALVQDGIGGVTLTERRVGPPYRKDYDELDGPTSWLRHGEIGHWGVFAAFDGPRTRRGYRGGVEHSGRVHAGRP